MRLLTDNAVTAFRAISLVCLLLLVIVVLCLAVGDLTGPRFHADPDDQRHGSESPSSRLDPMPSPMARRLVDQDSRFLVHDHRGIAVAGIKVCLCTDLGRAVRIQRVLGDTGDDGELRVERFSDDGAAIIAQSDIYGTAVFHKVHERFWRCTLPTNHGVHIRLRLETGEVVLEPCSAVLSRRPWSLHMSRLWSQGALQWAANPADPGVATYVAQATSGSLRFAGLAEGQYYAEVACEGHVAVEGVSETTLISVPGGPYECTMRPILAAVVGVEAPDEILCRAFKLPPGVTATPAQSQRTMKLQERQLEQKYPRLRWISVVGLPDGPQTNGAWRVRVEAISALRGRWEKEVDMVPLSKLVPHLSETPVKSDCAVTVRLDVRDSLDREISDARVTLVGGKSDHGRDFTVQLTHGTSTRVPRGEFRLDSPCRPLRAALAGHRVAVARGGPLLVKVPAPLVACRVTIDSGSLDVAGTRVSLSNQAGSIWQYGCDGDQPLAWVPEGRVLVSVTAPGFMPFTGAFDVTSRSGRVPEELRVSLSVVGR